MNKRVVINTDAYIKCTDLVFQRNKNELGHFATKAKATNIRTYR